MPLLLILLFIVVPIAELYVIIQVGDAIGVWPTIALLLLDGFLGAYLARSQGRGAQIHDGAPDHGEGRPDPSRYLIYLDQL